MGVEWKDADLPSSQGSGSVSAVQRVITAPYVSRRYLSREAQGALQDEGPLQDDKWGLCKTSDGASTRR